MEAEVKPFPNHVNNAVSLDQSEKLIWKLFEREKCKIKQLSIARNCASLPNFRSSLLHTETRVPGQIKPGFSSPENGKKPGLPSLPVTLRLSLLSVENRQFEF